jgi:hypothetical protein
MTEWCSRSAGVFTRSTKQGEVMKAENLKPRPHRMYGYRGRLGIFIVHLSLGYRFETAGGGEIAACARRTGIPSG